MHSKVQLRFENEDLKSEVEQLQSAIQTMDHELGFLTETFNDYLRTINYGLVNSRLVEYTSDQYY